MSSTDRACCFGGDQRSCFAPLGAHVRGPSRDWLLLELPTSDCVISCLEVGRTEGLFV